MTAKSLQRGNPIEFSEKDNIWIYLSIMELKFMKLHQGK